MKTNCASPRVLTNQFGLNLFLNKTPLRLLIKDKGIHPPPPPLIYPKFEIEKICCATKPQKNAIFYAESSVHPHSAIVLLTFPIPFLKTI